MGRYRSVEHGIRRLVVLRGLKSDRAASSIPSSDPTSDSRPAEAALACRRLSTIRRSRRSSAVGGVPASPNGSNTSTPAGSKCLVFRLTTVRPCSSAVAAMIRSADSCPRSPDRRPRRRAVGTSTLSTRSPYQVSTRSNQTDSSPGKRRVAVVLSGDAAFDLADGHHAQEHVGWPLRPKPRGRSRVRWVGAKRTPRGVEQIHHHSTSRSFTGV